MADYVIHGNTKPSTEYWSNNSSPAINQLNLNQIEDAIYRIFNDISTLSSLKSDVERLKSIENVLNSDKPYVPGSSGDKSLSELQGDVYKVIMQRLGYLLKDITPVYDDSDVLQSININLNGVNDVIATRDYVDTVRSPRFNQYSNGELNLEELDTTTDCFVAIVHNVGENKIDDLTITCKTASDDLILDNSDFNMFDDDYIDYINIGYQRMHTDGDSNIALVTISLYDDGGYNFRQMKKIISGISGIDAIKKITLSGIEDMEYDVMAYTPGVSSSGVTYQTFESQQISCT